MPIPKDKIAKLDRISETLRDLMSKEFPDCGVMAMWGVVDENNVWTGINSENLGQSDMHCIMFNLNGRAYRMANEK